MSPKRSRLLRVEETQEGRVLGEEGFDLGDSGAGPVLQPGVAEVVLDPVKAAFTHSRKYRHAARTAPWAERLIRVAPGPILLGREGPADREFALRPGHARHRERRCRGPASRDRDASAAARRRSYGGGAPLVGGGARGRRRGRLAGAGRRRGART